MEKRLINKYKTGRVLNPPANLSKEDMQLWNKAARMFNSKLNITQKRDVVDYMAKEVYPKHKYYYYDQKAKLHIFYDLVRGYAEGKSGYNTPLMEVDKKLKDGKIYTQRTYVPDEQMDEFDSELDRINNSNLTSEEHIKAVKSLNDKTQKKLVSSTVKKSTTTKPTTKKSVIKTAANGKYTIQAGDTLSKLAKRFNTTVEQLAADNNIQNANKIIAGKTLIINKASQKQNKKLTPKKSVYNKPSWEDAKKYYIQQNADVDPDAIVKAANEAAEQEAQNAFKETLPIYSSPSRSWEDDSIYPYPMPSVPRIFQEGGNLTYQSRKQGL